MRNGHPRKNRAGLITGALLLLAIEAGAALAQGGPPSGLGAPTSPNPKTASQEREIREGRLRSAEMVGAADKKSQQNLEATIVQVKEDFSRIQIVRNQIAHNLVTRNPLDYSLISTQTEEINKHAHRLKTYMLPHALEDKEKQQKELVEFDNQDMTSALVRLCKLIDSFVENPVLKNSATVAVQDLEKAKADKAKADEDLLNIVELSGRIRRSAERLSKTQ